MRRSLAAPLSLFFVLWGTLRAAGQEGIVRDDLGHEFRISGLPRRIISLAPNITEVLFALGLGERIIGVTRYCDYPAEATRRQKVGGFLDPDIERIRALAPDLVVAFRGNPLESLRRLKDLGLRVFILDIGNTLDAVPRTIEKIGRITAREAEARAMIAALASKGERVTAALKTVSDRPRVFLKLQGAGLFTCGAASYLNDLIARAGGVNVASDINRDWMEYQPERLVRDDPDVLVILAGSSPDFSAARDWLLSRPELQTLKAFKAGRILHLEENAASRFGPRLFDSLLELARLLHPDRY